MVDKRTRTILQESLVDKRTKIILQKGLVDMATRFERQMDELHVEMIKMGSLCEKAISLSAKAILEHEERTVQQVFAVEKEIDEKEREIERICISLLLHQHPVARDLRAVSTAMRMISDMERIGDQAADIADLSRYVDTHVTDIPAFVEQMAKYTVKMVTESIDAFVKKDLELCRKVIKDDDLVDEEFNNAKENLVELLGAKGLDIMAGLDLLMTAKYFERIGDHAVNIAEWVEFSITGRYKDEGGNSLG